jgi:hypothetical protein
MWSISRANYQNPSPKKKIKKQCYPTLCGSRKVSCDSFLFARNIYPPTVCNTVTTCERWGRWNMKRLVFLAARPSQRQPLQAIKPFASWCDTFTTILYNVNSSQVSAEKTRTEDQHEVFERFLWRRWRYLSISKNHTEWQRSLLSIKKRDEIVRTHINRDETSAVHERSYTMPPRSSPQQIYGDSNVHITSDNQHSLFTRRIQIECMVHHWASYYKLQGLHSERWSILD